MLSSFSCFLKIIYVPISVGPAAATVETTSPILNYFKSEKRREKYIHLYVYTKYFFYQISKRYIRLFWDVYSLPIRG
jgi:hypothetical protein